MRDSSWFTVNQTQQLEVCEDDGVFDARTMIESTMIPRIRTSHLKLEAPTPTYTRQLRVVREMLAQAAAAPAPKRSPRWLAIGALLMAVATIAILL
jgi:hypothetical protein